MLQNIHLPVGHCSSRKKFVNKFKAENDLDYSPSQIVISCGAKHSLYNIFQVICEKGDEVLIVHPYWLSYPEMVRLAGGTPKFITTSKDNGYRVTPEEIKENVTDKTIAIILNSPSNPAGIVYAKEELAAIAEVCLEKGIKIISDEIYEKIVFDGKEHVSIASISDEIKDNTILVNGVSKSFSMTGWRIGYIAADEEIIKKINTLQSHSTSNPCSISQKAAECALAEDMTGLLKQNCESFEKRRDMLFDLLNDIKGLAPLKPSGAFYLFCNISGTGMDSVTFAEKLLEEKKVVVIPGGPFGADDFVRISFAASVEALQEGVARMKAWIEG